jgi:hypothetical protein
MTTTLGRWFPATIQIPGEPKPRRRVYVVLAQSGDHSGLHVWARPGDVADWHAPVDFGRTVVPPQRQARNGFEVHLADGSAAVVTLNQGCRCGALGHWSGPVWATSVAVGA